MGRGNVEIDEKDTIDRRSEKVKRIFQHFDLNKDGGLNWEEMAAFVIAANPRVKFSDDQLDAIKNEVFLNYPEFIDGEKGLTLQGLLRTYDDGAGDVDRDFDLLGLDLEPETGTAATSSSIASERVAVPDTKTRAAKWEVLLNHTIFFHNTYKFLDDLDILIQKLKSKQAKDRKLKNNYNKDKFADLEMSEKRVNWEELGQTYAVFVIELNVLRSRANRECSSEETFDRHMAIGRVLYHYHLFKEAAMSFRIASEFQPDNVIPRFQVGNCLYELGRNGEANQEYVQALVDGNANRSKWAHVLPQIHINLGITLACDGMVFNACDHYREAIISCPTHFRALKLGSALIAIGEYTAGIMALEEAMTLRNDLTDAHCDMAVALLAVGDEHNAINEFQKVLDLKPGHVDALFNLAELYMNMGEYLRASDMYSKVLDVCRNHWKAQLGKAVSSFAIGENEEAKKAVKEVLKWPDRVELHDRIAYLKQLRKRTLKGNMLGIWEEAYITVEPFKFKAADDTTTLRSELVNALDIRAFQKITRLNRCDVELIKKQMNENTVPISYSDSGLPVRSIRKVALEVIIRELLGFLKPETFVGAVKAINLKILCVLDDTNSGRVDLGLFLAIIAPLCRGTPDRRKRVAYDALLGQYGKEANNKIRRTDAQRYIKLLRYIHIPSLGISEMLGIQEEMDQSLISLPEFLQMFDDPDGGFGIMSTLFKLESGHRNGSYVCATCRIGIIGPRFKEMKSHFSLCSQCYSECKVPATLKQEEYIFKEYAN